MSYINVVKREFERIKKSPIIWASTFILPFLMCFLICIIFAKGSPQDMPVAVFNQDNSEISRVFVRNINTLSTVKVKYQVTSLKEGEELLKDGKAYGFIYIPKDFQRDIYRYKQPPLVFYYNNQRILIGGIISKDINMIAQTMMVGADAKLRMKSGVPKDIAISQANLIKVNEHIRSNPYFNYLYFLALIAFGHILQVHFVLSVVYVIGTEFKYGSAKEWLECADNSILKAFFGKVAPYFVIFTLVMAIIYLIYFGFYNVPYTGSIWVGILTSLLFITSCISFATLFIAFNGNLRYAISGSAFFVAMGFAFSGVTYPVMAMPLPSRVFSATMPIYYYIQTILDQTFRQIPLRYDLIFILIQVFITVICLLSLILIKKYAYDETRWYQK
ncbi:ABC transporter permease [bacterium]|nr:ABC transporter permease [bacterium]